MTGRASATAPVGVLALQNNALVGLGTASRNVDSLDASVVLGINGVILMPNGDATVRLNVDTLINNYCHIVTGTAFGGTPVTGNRLLIDSVVPKELRIKSDGVLDLTQFTSTMQTLVISGAVNMVLEPGAQVLLGGGNLIFAGDSRLYCEPDTSLHLPVGLDVMATNAMRVKFSGSGRVTFKENATFVVPRGALVGIENNADVLPTNQSWAFTDDASFELGSDSEFGGGFQVGDTLAANTSPIDFTLVLTGVGALLDLNSQGFLGFGVGIVDKPQSAPNNWLVGTLFNVGDIIITIPEGAFKHQQIYSGDNNLAGLLAVSENINYSFTFDRINADILGGGNMILLPAIPLSVAVSPTVLDIATSNIGIMSSKAALMDYPKFILQPLVNVTGTDFFNFLSLAEYTTQYGKISTIFRSRLGETTIGFVFNNTGVNLIRREFGGNIKGLNGTYVNPNNSLGIGAVGIAVEQVSGAASLSQINPQQ